MPDIDIDGQSLVLLGALIAALAGIVYILSFVLPDTLPARQKIIIVAVPGCLLVLLTLAAYDVWPFTTNEEATFIDGGPCFDAVAKAQLSDTTDHWVEAKNECSLAIVDQPDSGDLYFWLGYAEDKLNSNCAAIDRYSTAVVKGTHFSELAQTEIKLLRSLGSCP